MDPEIGDGAISNCEGIGSQMGERGGGGGYTKAQLVYRIHFHIYIICVCI